MSKQISKRIIADIVLFLLILVAPWWLSISFALVSLLYFKSYYEFIIAGFLVDMLYGTAQSWLFDLPLAYFVISIFIFVLTGQIKNMLR